MKTLSASLSQVLFLTLISVLSVAWAEDPPPATQQVDRLELDASAIKGNQELPKVMYILPWKESGIGDLRGKPVNSLLDEVLAPVDRDVFRRQVRYFDQLYAVDKQAPADKD